MARIVYDVVLCPEKVDSAYGTFFKGMTQADLFQLTELLEYAADEEDKFRLEIIVRKVFDAHE